MSHEENELIATDRSVITDINAGLVETLSEEEKNYYDNLPSQQKKDYFVHMGKTDRKTLMNGSVNKEEETLMWSYASTLALRIYNEGFGLTERVRKIRKVGHLCLTIAVVAGFCGIVTSTFVKNQKIQSYISHEQTDEKSIPSAATNNNNGVMHE